jgi:hypothetical protein
MRKRTHLWLILTAALAVTIFGTVLADNDDRRLSTNLTGEAEVPGPGDPDGRGKAKLRFDVRDHEICYKLNVSRISPATAAHIHIGTADVAGPVVVHLQPPTDGSSNACTVVDRDLVKEIIRHPERYYVNVHNADFPAGAVRGQLSK